MVYKFEKFRAYLLGTKVVVHTDYDALRYLMVKKEAKPRLIWLEDDVVATGGREINDAFLDESIMLITQTSIPWYADYANFIVCGLLLEGLNNHQMRKFLFDVKRYIWDEPFLFRECVDNIIRCCVPEVKVQEILEACHASPAGGHLGDIRTTFKVLQYGYFGLTMFKDFCNSQYEALLAKYGVKYEAATLSHPQSIVQVEVSNQKIKNILPK
ncbi:hypothetical protein MTR67_030735 [Solanum verrucosum]|uniref:Reverse transcriptase RNase H-like domain-containing protein n=1 Tax=Solanum verrucosum TaxID=315347 RepID=A0AAF0U157_SOLVR|nr:hypothetical protein MTR67_030735 [Solanum verrucosum]